jgi:hypothetical protein
MLMMALSDRVWAPTLAFGSSFFSFFVSISLKHFYTEPIEKPFARGSIAASPVLHNEVQREDLSIQFARSIDDEVILQLLLQKNRVRFVALPNLFKIEIIGIPSCLEDFLEKFLVHFRLLDLVLRCDSDHREAVHYKTMPDTWVDVEPNLLGIGRDPFDNDRWWTTISMIWKMKQRLASKDTLFSFGLRFSRPKLPLLSSFS